jgi:hypothetical protein
VASIVGAAALERLVDSEVRASWDSRVKTFVPILTWRTVRKHLVVMGASDAEPLAPGA